MRIRKRYIIFTCIIGLIVFGSIIALTRPVLPFIQLPGEIWPPTRGIPVINGITNTFAGSLVAWILVVAAGLSLRARSRTADEVPTGFYNFFETIVDVGVNFATNLAGTKRAKDFFPLFFTLIIYILLANWLELIPGVDSIGFYEFLPHAQAEKVAVELESSAADLAQVAFESEEEREAFVHAQEEVFIDGLDPTAPEVGYRLGIFLVRPQEDSEGDERLGWTLVPFVRPAATDLSFTLALALFTMFMVQYYGFKYLGIGYLKKFVPWNVSVDVMAGNPIKAMDWAVGILELIGEITRIISFAFRLLGNIFAGQVLLFVIAFLIPLANVVFFGLEFFVGLIQAMIFGLLGVIFMSGATESHHEEHDEH